MISLPRALTASWSASRRRVVAGTEHAREALHVHGRDDVVHRLEGACASPSGSVGSRPLSGFLRASQVAIAGNSVSTEPSSLLQRRHLGLRIELHEVGAVLLLLGAVDLLQVVRLADLLEQNVDADRAGAGHVIELHGSLPLRWVSSRTGDASIARHNGGNTQCRQTHLRSLVGTPGPKVGTFLFEFATPGIGQILKAAGADFAVLDMEHTGFGFDTVRQVVRYCQAAGLPLVVRVPSQQRHHISRALDTGADGVMVPIVSSVEQAKAVLDAAKYWPDGTRGVALGLAHERFADAHRAAGAALRRTECAHRHHPAGRGSARRRGGRRDRGDARRRHAVARPQRPLGGAGRARRLRPSRFRQGRAGDIAAAKKHGKSAGRLASMPGRARSSRPWATTSSRSRATSGCCSRPSLRAGDGEEGLIAGTRHSSGASCSRARGRA